MKISPASNRFNRSGFTLVEILMVMTIIIVLAGLGIFSYNYVQRLQKEKAAQLQVAEMTKAVGDFRLDGGEVLTGDGSEGSSTFLYQMISGDSNSDGMLDDQVKSYIPNLASGGQKGGYKVSPQYEILDPYGSPYRYEFPGRRNPPNEADVWSIGPDKRDGTDDDIKNW